MGNFAGWGALNFFMGDIWGGRIVHPFVVRYLKRAALFLWEIFKGGA